MVLFSSYHFYYWH